MGDLKADNHFLIMAADALKRVNTANEGKGYHTIPWWFKHSQRILKHHISCLFRRCSQIVCVDEFQETMRGAAVLGRP